jgi:hypothetical protein
MQTKLRWAGPLLLLAAAAWVASCAEVPSSPPVPRGEVEAAQVPGYGAIRHWGDLPLPPRGHERAQAGAAAPPSAGGAAKRRLTVLAISGGGSNGAFAAGLLTGLTQAGRRPDFDIVSGVSVGALAAPFAFLGPAYDGKLRELFAALGKSDTVARRPVVLAPFADALASAAPLEALIAKEIDEPLVRAIAAEHRKGRRLFVATTHVYAGRQVIWDIGAIAASGRPDALDLIRRVLQASCSVPIVLPPVYFEVEAGGRRYSEMHVDGALTRQVFVAPPDFDWDAAARERGADRHADFYVILNGRAKSEYMVMPPRASALGEHAMHQLAQSLGIGDLYLIYVRAEHDGARFHAAWIGDDFDAPWGSWFDPGYIEALFAYGRAQATRGPAWRSLPPGLD